MATFSRYKPQTEKELHIMIEKELDGIEDGIKLLKYEYTTSKGVLDFLCVDSGGILVIIEIKLHEDDNILFQALRYYSEIDKNRYLISTLFPKSNINPEKNPRIILIAEHISDDVRRLSTLVIPKVELFEYSTLRVDDKIKGICYQSRPLPIDERPPQDPETIATLIEYLNKKELKPVLEKVRKEIRELGESIEEYPTQSYLGYKHSTGRQFAWIQINRKSFDIGAIIIDENRQLIEYEQKRIEAGSEHYNNVFGIIKKSFVNLGGKLRK